MSDTQQTRALIDKSLQEELIYARDNLNELEANKKGGIKKKKWTILTTSKKLAKLLKNMRTK